MATNNKKVIDVEHLGRFLTKCKNIFPSSDWAKDVETRLTAGFGLTTEIVESLPTTGIKSNVLYLKKTSGSGQDQYEEYIYSNNAWELLGTTQVAAVDVVDNLTSTDKTKALSANQGKVLLEKIGEGGLSRDQQSYLNSLMEADIKKKFTVSQSTSGSRVKWADSTSTLNYKITVLAKYNGNPCECQTYGNYAPDTTTGTYTYTIETAPSSIGATTFTYKYNDGITCSATAPAASTVIKNPIWYGWSTSNNPDEVNSVLNSLTKPNNESSDRYFIDGEDIKNTGSQSRYFWAITHNSATAKQNGSINIFKDPVTKSITSGGTMLSDYKIYITENPTSAGGTVSGVVLNIYY